MKSNQEDYIFNQVLEMFPQLDTKIVYLVLSESEFNVDNAISNLTMLSQSVEMPTMELVPNDIKQNEEQSFKSSSDHLKFLETTELHRTKENFHTPTTNISKQIQPVKKSPNMSLECNGNTSSYNDGLKMMKSKLCTEEMNDVETSFIESEHSVYLPYYDTMQSFDDFQIPLDSNDLTMTLNIAAATTKDLLPKNIAPSNNADRSLNDEKSDIPQKRFTNFNSYVFVGKTNGKRLIFHGQGHTNFDMLHSSQIKNITLESKRDDKDCLIQDLKALLPQNEPINQKNHNTTNISISEKRTSDSNMKSSQPFSNSLTYSSIKSLNNFKIPDSHTLLPQESNFTITNDNSTGALNFDTKPDSSDLKFFSSPPPGLKKKRSCTNTVNSLPTNVSKSSIDVHHSNSKVLKQQPAVNSLPKPTPPFQNTDSSDFVIVNRSHRKSQNKKSSTSLKRSEIKNPFQETSKSRSSSCTLYVLRGPSGSGKSTLAKEILGNSQGQILSSDDFFSTRNGYAYDWVKLPEAHEWNKRRAKDCFSKGVTPIIIDNTNSTSWEMKPYMEMAVKFRYKIVIREPNTRWKFKANELAKRNTHGVSKETIKAMLERYEKNVTVRKVLGEESFRIYEQNCLKPSPESKRNDENKKQRSGDAKSNDLAVLPETPKTSNVDQNEDKVCKPTKKLDTELSTTILSPTSISSNTSCSLSKITDVTTQADASQTASASSTFSPTNVSTVEKDESLPSTPSEEKTPRSANDSSVAVKKKKRKTKTLAARFPAKTLSEHLTDSSDNWKNFMNIIDNQSNTESSPDQREPTPNRCDSATITEEEYFTLVLKIEANIKAATDDVVLTTDSERYKSGFAAKRKKLNKILYDKSSMTTDLFKGNDETSDLKTLQVLFPDFDEKRLRHVYEKCDKKLEWATDVVAESSLFGKADDFLSFGKGEPTTSMSLDVSTDAVVQDDSLVRQRKSLSEAGLTVPQADCLCLDVSAQFLRQLIALFGDKNDDPVDVKSTTLAIGYDLAYAIYHNWKSAFRRSLMNEVGNAAEQRNMDSSRLYLMSDYMASSHLGSIEQLRKDEELARRIQNEEDQLHSAPALSSNRRNRKQFHSRIVPEHSTLSLSKWSVDQKQPDSLSQIMSEETAALESVKRQSTKFVNMKLAAQMKREELHAMYRDVPSSLLDDVFAANDYNLEDSISAIDRMLDDKFPLKTMTTSGSLQPYFVTDRGKNRPLNQNPSDVDISAASESHRRVLTYDDVHSDMFTTYDDIRTEANMHRLQFLECQRKAALANNQKKGALAFYYGQQAQEHQKLLREANQRAAAVIYRRMNEGRSSNELDLHGLHVDEAIDTLRSVIAKLQRENDVIRNLTVITGRGLNSSDGIPKVKKAVVEWLNNKQITHEPLNEGCLKVSW